MFEDENIWLNADKQWIEQDKRGLQDDLRAANQNILKLKEALELEKKKNAELSTPWKEE